jgi:hypothetical protein
MRRAGNPLLLHHLTALGNVRHTAQVADPDPARAMASNLNRR